MRKTLPKSGARRQDRSLSCRRIRRLDPFAVACVAFGALLRFATIAVQPYWFDERLTQGTLRLSFGDVLDRLITTGDEANPPLYYVLAWVWTRILGDGEVALRSLSAIFGTATIAVAYVLARELVTVRVARVVALLTAVSPLLIWYSQEARAYALLALLSALSLLWFVRALQRPEAARPWALFSCLALLTHYFAFFIVAVEAIWLIRRHRRRIAAPVAVVALTAAALAPLALHQRSAGGTEWISDVSLFGRLKGSANAFLIGASPGLELAGAVLLVVAVAGLALAARAAPDERRGALVALTVAAGTLALPLVLAIGGVDLVNGRNLIVAWLPIAIVVGTGFGSRRAGRAGVAGAVVFVTLSVAVVIAVAIEPEFQREPASYPARPDDPR